MKTIIALLCAITLLTPTRVVAQTNKLIFGLGPEANEAINKPLVKDSPIKMLSSWYNGSSDLAWMANWKTGVVPSSYARGYALHLIIFSNDHETQLQSTATEVCGRAYPLSSQYLEDVHQLADIFKGNGVLYVTMFTEFQTYPCLDNQWKGSENYYQKLKEQYSAARKIFKATNPNAKVSLGWGGWQARYDDKQNQGGRSLFSHFEDVMGESDFQSFQSMQSDHNTQDIVEMTTILSRFGPVMLSHYKPDNRSQQTFDKDMRKLFTDEYINQITTKGLFALSIMDHHNLDNSPTTYNIVKTAINKYTSSQVTLPSKEKLSPTPQPTPNPETTKPQSKTGLDSTTNATEFTAENFMESNSYWHLLLQKANSLLTSLITKI